MREIWPRILVNDFDVGEAQLVLQVMLQLLEHLRRLAGCRRRLFVLVGDYSLDPGSGRVLLRANGFPRVTLPVELAYRRELYNRKRATSDTTCEDPLTLGIMCPSMMIPCWHERRGDARVDSRRMFSLPCKVQRAKCFEILALVRTDH